MPLFISGATGDAGHRAKVADIRAGSLSLTWTGDKHLTHRSVPRTLAAQLRNAGFQDVRMDAHAFATNELIPDAYGGSLVPLLEQYVPSRVE